MFVCSDDTVVLLNPGLGDRLVCTATDQLISSYEEPEEVKDQSVHWAVAEGEGHDQGHRLILKHPKVIKTHTNTPRLSDYIFIRMPSSRQPLAGNISPLFNLIYSS